MNKYIQVLGFRILSFADIFAFLDNVILFTESSSKNNKWSFSINYYYMHLSQAHAHGEFCRCHSGKCILQKFVCDGEQDCELGEDEGACLKEIQKPCASDEYTCPGGHCIKVCSLIVSSFNFIFLYFRDDPFHVCWGQKVESLIFPNDYREKLDFSPLYFFASLIEVLNIM